MKEQDTVFDQLISNYSRSEFEERLENVDEAQARARPIEGRHSIWEIVNHCTYRMEAAIGAVNGEEMPPRGENGLRLERTRRPGGKIRPGLDGHSTGSWSR